MRFHGMVVQESLVDVTVLERLNITRVERWEVGSSAVEWQSPVWTATYFEYSADEVADVAALLSGALHPDRPWYANMGSPTQEIVVFHGRVIAYERGDLDGYRAAQEYARSVGVPEHQLAWSAELEARAQELRAACGSA